MRDDNEALWKMYMESQVVVEEGLLGRQAGFDAQRLSWFHNKIPTIETNAIKSRARHHWRSTMEEVGWRKYVNQERGFLGGDLKGASGASR